MNINIIARCLLRQSSILPALAGVLKKSQCVSFSSSAALSRFVFRMPIPAPSKTTQGPAQPAPATSQKTESIDQSRYIMADTRTSALTVWEDLKQMRFSPVPALALGFAGLIPFMAAPGFMLLTKTFYANLAFAQTAYGACILSFLGGVRWGFVLPEGSQIKADWFNLGYSVTPSLVAWGALLLPSPISNLTILAGIAGSAYFDTAVKGYPSWFKGLRFVLSLGAVLSLWSVFMCQCLLYSRKDKMALNQIEQGFQDEKDQDT